MRLELSEEETQAVGLMFSLDIFCFRKTSELFFPTIRSKPYYVGLVDPFASGFSDEYKP